MNITLIAIGVLITLSTFSAILILAALTLSSQGSYRGQEVGQELLPARETETIGEIQRGTAPVI